MFENNWQFIRNLVLGLATHDTVGKNIVSGLALGDIVQVRTFYYKGLATCDDTKH